MLELWRAVPVAAAISGIHCPLGILRTTERGEAMALQHTRVTEAEFEHFIEQPENEGRDFELIGGEIFEVVSNNYCSLVGARLVFLITRYLYDNSIEGYISGADGGYMVSGERYMPDVG